MTARRLGALTVVASIAAVATAGAARSDGLPVLSVDVGQTGVASAVGPARYVTLRDGRRTVVARVRRDGGQVIWSRVLPGTFTIPAVAYDGSASGLSANGRTLVLIQPRTAFPRRQTRFVVLNAPRLRPTAAIRLRGDFSFDAISPDGRDMYLIQYVAPKDPTRYLVRAYDLRLGRLLDAPVVDPHETGEKMRGNPLSRAVSADGRWAYTLYDGAGGTPFLHALDTSGRTARCIDLDALAGNQYLWRLRLRVDPNSGNLVIRDGKESELVVDTKTFRPHEPAPAAAEAGPAHADSGGAWPLIGWIGLGVLVAAALVVAGRPITRVAGRSARLER